MRAPLQAKGTSDIEHHYWQGRLPALFVDATIATLAAADAPLPELLRYRNAEVDPIVWTTKRRK